MKIHRIQKPTDISDLLRSRRNTVEYKEEKKKTSSRSSNYQKFLKKYYDLEENMDKLNSIDLTYYFREIAGENGHNYTIANIKKDAHIFKVLQETYDNREICGMIVFLYESEQNYLDKDRLSPNLLASQWINTIYADFNLWLDDKYVPKKKSRKTREWEDSTKDEVVEIGVKL